MFDMVQKLVWRQNSPAFFPALAVLFNQVFVNVTRYVIALDCHSWECYWSGALNRWWLWCVLPAPSPSLLNPVSKVVKCLQTVFVRWRNQTAKGEASAYACRLDSSNSDVGSIHVENRLSWAIKVAWLSYVHYLTVSCLRWGLMSSGVIPCLVTNYNQLVT